ncbi:MAG: MATE family efflux transporter [Dysosmobacter welbionis]
MLNAPHETAAVTVAYPSFLMLTAISNLFGVGGASAIARALGRQDEEGARRIAAVSLAGGLLSALLFSAAFRLLADPVLHLCGATEATYATAYGYAKWVVILGGLHHSQHPLADLVRAEGAPEPPPSGSLSAAS